MEITVKFDYTGGAIFNMGAGGTWQMARCKSIFQWETVSE